MRLREAIPERETQGYQNECQERETLPGLQIHADQMNRWETPWGLTMEHLVEKWKHVVDAGAECFSWTSGHELSFLCEAASRASSICEIGSYHGRSALTMALASPKAHLDCFDICDHAEVEAEFFKNLAGPISEKRVRFYEGTSCLLRAIPSSYSLGFIDAGHTEKDVKTDIENLLPHMLRDSILCGHDFNANPDDGVNKAVMAAFPGGVGLFQSLWWTRLP